MTTSAVIVNTSNWQGENILVTDVDMYENGELIDGKLLKPGEKVNVYPNYPGGIQPRITVVGDATEPFRNEDGEQVFPVTKVIFE